MELSIPLLAKESSLSGDWLRVDQSANAALVKSIAGQTETLIYVVFGDDFIAGLRVDRKTWVLLPTRSVFSVTFNYLGSGTLPPVRQTSDAAREYLQGVGAVDLRVWMMGQAEPMPTARASVQGSWLIMTRSDEGTAERMVAFDSVALIEVFDVAAAVRELDPRNAGFPNG